MKKLWTTKVLVILPVLLFWMNSGLMAQTAPTFQGAFHNINKETAQRILNLQNQKSYLNQYKNVSNQTNPYYKTRDKTYFKTTNTKQLKRRFCANLGVEKGFLGIGRKKRCNKAFNRFVAANNLQASAIDLSAGTEDINKKNLLKDHMNRDAAKWYLKVRAMNGDLNSHGSSTSQVDPYKQYRGKTYKKSIRKLKRKSRKKLCRNLLGKGKIFDFKRKKKCTKAINQYIEDHDITI